MKPSRSFWFLALATSFAVSACSLGTDGAKSDQLTLEAKKAEAGKKDHEFDLLSITAVSSTQTTITLQVCAGESGAPQGFSLQFVTEEAYALAGGWPEQNLCEASLSGSARDSRFELDPNECVEVVLGDLGEENGLSYSDACNALECGTTYMIRGFAKGQGPTEFTEPFAASTAACEDGCTYTQGFWKNHEAAWPVESLTLGSVNYSAAELDAILETDVNGNGLIQLAHQLIAAKLNVANGADDSAIADVISDADALIGALSVPPVGDGSLPTAETSALNDALAAFNQGETGPGHCDDSGDDDDGAGGAGGDDDNGDSDEDDDGLD